MSVTRTVPPARSATSPSSRKMTRRVWASTAATSEARKFSPSPRPTMSGHVHRAPRRAGRARRDGARRPRRRRRPGAGRPARPRRCRRHRPPRRDGRAPRCRSPSRAGGPRAVSSSRSSLKFSMMPLWMTVSSPRAVDVRVRVEVVGPPVGRPAGVRETDRRRAGVASTQRRPQVGQLARALLDEQLARRA